MPIIGILVTIILLNEFSDYTNSKITVLNKVSKVIQKANLELKLILYIAWFFYLFIYNFVFFITRSQFRAYLFCQFFSRAPILGRALNLTFSLIRSAILEEKNNARNI